MVSFLKFLLPFLLKLLKFLEPFKKGLFGFISWKIFNFITNIVLKAEKVRFRQMIKAIYITLSAFNFILALIILIKVTDLDNNQIMQFIFTSLKWFLPVVILDIISDFWFEFSIHIKNLIKEFLKWVFSDSNKELPSPKTNKLPNRKRVMDTPEPI